MAAPKEVFHDVLTEIIAHRRKTRTWNHRQRKRPGLVKDWHRARMLTLQSAYMLMTRAALLNNQHDTESYLAVRCDDPFLEVVQQWVNSLTSETLFKASQAQDPRLLLCFIGLYLEHSDMGVELARQVEGKRFTVELIRTQWGGEDRADEVGRLFNRAKRFAPDLQKRFLKDPINEAPSGKPSDFEQMSWQRALEWWEETTSDARKKIAMDKRDNLVWFETTPILPHEQAFFNGPVTKAWRGSLSKVLADHETLSKTELLPNKLREMREAAVEKIERRQSLAPIAEPSSSPPTYDGDERDTNAQDPVDEQMFRNWTHSTDSNDEALAERILAISRQRGEPTTRVVEFIVEGMTADLAAQKSGLSPSERAAFLIDAKRLRR